MHVVTGGCGFIGSNIVARLNNQGINNILVVDDFNESTKLQNIAHNDVSDFVHKDRFLTEILNGKYKSDIEIIFHQGACADTMEPDGNYMMENNYEYSKHILEYCARNKIPLIYASSAAVYGPNRETSESKRNENPLNIYAYSKLMFDRYVTKRLNDIDSTVVGLRYFNVYGPNELHKGKMASMVYQAYKQLNDCGEVKLFAGDAEFSDGEQKRDFVYVKDVVDVNLHFAGKHNVKGIFNLGTGIPRSFNDVANTLITLMNKGSINYIPFPFDLKNKYQNYTKADTIKLASTGVSTNFTSLEEGIAEYFTLLENPDVNDH